MLDHWHPILPSKRLRRQPIGVKLAGEEIALFRTKDGRIGAVSDICPHRRYRLSLGQVINDRLQCKYHGWTFACDGQGESPGTPKMHTCVTCYETREVLGYVWLKSAESNPVFPAFPNFETDRFVFMCSLEHIAVCPLETTLDNFSEMEHTPTTHAIFGYDLDRMAEAVVRYEPTESSVRIFNSGPPKRMNWFLRKLIGIRPDFLFRDDWTTNFSPVYSVYDHYWGNPETGEESKVRFRVYHFFKPIDEKTTGITTFAFGKSRWPGPYGGLRPFRWLYRRNLNREVNLDVAILHGLVDQRTSLEGMKLSRFDKSLGLNRERINRMYRGIDKETSVGT